MEQTSGSRKSGSNSKTQQSRPEQKKTSAGKRRRRRSRPPIFLILLSILLALALLFMVYRCMGLSNTIDEMKAAAAAAAAKTTQSSTLSPSRLEIGGFGYENNHRVYRDENTESTLGIDISAHQGAIDFDSLLTYEDLDYVILRCGYRGYGDGSVCEDEYFSSNIQALSETGLYLGIYFFSQAVTVEEAQEEAELTLSLIDGYQIDLPVYFDWEPVSDEGSRTADIDARTVTDCAKRFCETIEAAGYRAGVYFSPAVASGWFLPEELDSYDFWLAQYADFPTWPYSCGMWQYTYEGSVPGIDTIVDLNIRFTAKKENEA